MVLPFHVRHELLFLRGVVEPSVLPGSSEPLAKTTLARSLACPEVEPVAVLDADKFGRLDALVNNAAWIDRTETAHPLSGYGPLYS